MSLIGKFATVGTATLGSRIFGFLRETLMAAAVGTGPVADAFNAAFRFPNTFRRLFGEGALSAAFIPEYTQATRTDPEEARRFASLTMVSLAALTSVIALVIEIGLFVALLLAPPSPDRTLSLQLAMVMTLFMPLICSAAILAGMLQVSLVGYVVGGLFLGLAYFDLPYSLLALAVATHGVVAREVRQASRPAGATLPEATPAGAGL